MASTPTKITLSRSQDIPFNKLVLSQANVRRVKAGVSIADLADDIARRTLLQSLTVRAQVDAEGKETGLYEVPTGGRRFRALELLVQQKRLAKTAPIPCVLRTEGLGEEDSLAENTQREALHPLDQFRAFQALRDKGLDEADIAARFFVTPAVVKQRLRLATLSPRLLDLYAEDVLTLEQLMAFTVSANHDHQEQVWAALTQPWQREPYHIRRALTASSVPARDKRALFVGLETYVAAGGPVMRDLFTPDEGGWLDDVPLLDRLVAEKLAAAVEAVTAEGWKWIEADVDLAYGHTAGLRRLVGEVPPLTDAEVAQRDDLQAEQDRLLEAYAGPEDLPDDVDQRLADIEAALAQLDERPLRFDPAEMGRAGCFVSIASDGQLRVERGYVRPEDETPTASPDPLPDDAGEGAGALATVPALAAATAPDDRLSQEVEEEDGLKPLSERLVMELTAYRTLALRDALAQDPDTAMVAVLHVLCLQTFYHHAGESCLQITARSPGFVVQPTGLGDSAPARAIQARQDLWAGQLPPDPGALWDTLAGFDADSQAALFAHCAALTLHAVQASTDHRTAGGRHADRLATLLGLNLAAAGWVPTVESYLGRVTKARILEAVTEGRGADAAHRIDHLRKPDMATRAEQMLAGTGWLPEPLRTAGTAATPMGDDTAAGAEPMVEVLVAPEPVAAE